MEGGLGRQKHDQLKIMIMVQAARERGRSKVEDHGVSSQRGEGEKSEARAELHETRAQRVRRRS